MKNLKVGKSKIQGKGLFTTQPFTKGSFIGLAHEDDQPSTMIGKYHNHSETPNAMSVKVGGKRYLVAKRPLKNNEEITTDYRLQPELEQPDQFKRGGIAKLPKMPKPSKKGVLAKGYSRSIEATNRFFTENKLFEKPKSRKRKVFDPNANYEDGGSLPQAEYGMPMGTGASQNYEGRQKFIYEEGGAYYDDSRDAWVSADGKVGPNGPANYQTGGPIELELTDDEIEEYRRGGWIVEDIY